MEMRKEILMKLLDSYDDGDTVDMAILRRDYNRYMSDYIEERERMIEEIEERQHNSGMYAQQDLIEMYRCER